LINGAGADAGQAADFTQGYQVEVLLGEEPQNHRVESLLHLPVSAPFLKARVTITMFRNDVKMKTFFPVSITY
jgi:hypothetical protein